MTTVSPHTPERPRWTLEDRLVKARKHAHLSQAELGNLLGVHYKTVQKWELGQIPIKRGNLLGTAMACGVDAGWLEHGDGPDNGGTTVEFGHQTGSDLDTNVSRCTREPLRAA